jgi:predicted component of type VI protein secretion system
MPAQLVALNDGPSILLDKPILLLGRHPECDIQIDSRKISRRHCCIAQVSDYLVVRDLGSTNGVRINGVKVAEGRLVGGDELTIGNHRYRVSWDSAVNPRRGVPAAPPHMAQRPTVLDDEQLENCEEPVPLPEPAAAANVPYPVPGDPAVHAPAGQSLVLPEHIDLLPSDAFPGVSGPSPHPGA